VNDKSQLATVAAVRAIIGEPHRVTPLKVMDALDQMSVDFIRHSPFLMLATAGSNGQPEVSPKGDHP
jgi:predicted pyridoxine 5'-phosphate oxidase superfamily flavin-nucleotide-binding protein